MTVADAHQDDRVAPDEEVQARGESGPRGSDGPWADTARQAARDAGLREWTERAESWRRWAPRWGAQTAEATRLIVEAAGIAPGMRVLDVACGTGEPALTVAARVGPRGSVVATDLAPAMLAVARDLARQRGVTNVDVAVGGADCLPFYEASFDAVTCRFGIAHVPDSDRALCEMRRVLRPGGRAAFVVWGPRSRNPFFTIVDDAFASYPVSPTGVPVAPGPFTFASPGTLSAALDAAGFDDVREETRAITLRWPGSPEEAWQGRCEMSAASSSRLAALPAEDRARVTDAALRALRVYHDDRGVALPGVVIVASATR